jgi:hypothetical protein
MIKKLLLMATVIMGLSTFAYSQNLSSDYRTGLGFKVHWYRSGSITIKHFLKEQAALEGLVQFWRDGVNFTVLYEFHGDIAGAQGLKWYVGPGGHIGFYNDKYEGSDDGAFFGFDGVLGLDYKFRGAPINLSLDVAPGIDIPSGDFYVSGGFAMRFTF